ncbi:hypothetical protein ACQCT5_02540 [Sutcliffiella halmapala]
MRKADLIYLRESSMDLIQDKVVFLTLLVELNHIGIVGEENTDKFHDNSKELLDYILETQDGELALLLLQTFLHMQNHTKFHLQNNETNVRQLCKLIFIQFDKNKEEIYFLTLKLLNSVDELNENKAIYKSNIANMDGNIYECFRFDLTVELLHSYLLLDHADVRGLLMDTLTDWNEFKVISQEEAFEKLLWYGFSFGEEDYLADTIPDYDFQIKSERWGIKYYVYLLKKFSKYTPLDSEKVNRAISKFNKLPHYSAKEKEFFIQKIYWRLDDHSRNISNLEMSAEKVKEKKEEISTSN